MNWKLLAVCILIIIASVALVLFTPIGLMLLPIFTSILAIIMPYAAPLISGISNLLQSGQNLPIIGGAISGLITIGGVIATYVRSRFNALKEQASQQITQSKLQASDQVLTMQKDYEQQLATQVEVAKAQATEQIAPLQIQVTDLKTQLTQKQVEVDKLIAERNQAQRDSLSEIVVKCRNCGTEYLKWQINCPKCQTPQVAIA